MEGIKKCFLGTHFLILITSRNAMRLRILNLLTKKEKKNFDMPRGGGRFRKKSLKTFFLKSKKRGKGKTLNWCYKLEQWIHYLSILAN